MNDQISPQRDRYRGMPAVFIAGDPPRPAPFLMNRDEMAAFFRLQDSRTKFPEKTLQRYRRMGLKTVRVGRRVFFRLDDVLRFLDQQQDRLTHERGICSPKTPPGLISSTVMGSRGTLPRRT